MAPCRPVFGPLVALFGAEFNQPRASGRYRDRQCERGQAREVNVENRTGGIDRSEGVLRWVAVALAVALFVGTVACAGERAEAATADAVMASGSIPEHGQEVMYAQATAWRPEAGGLQVDSSPGAKPVPSDPAAHYMLGVSAWEEGELGEAELHLREWIAHAPGDAKGRVNLARVLIEIGRPYEAKEHAAIAEDLDPASVAAKRVHARALDESGDCASAIAKYEDALWIDPGDFWSLNNLGYLLIRHGRFEDAIGPLALAVHLDGANSMFQSNLLAALEGAGHSFASLDAFDAATRAAAFRRELRGTPPASGLLIAECPG